MQQVVTFLSGKANAFSVTLSDEPVLSLTGFPVVTLPHIDNDATSTPGERKVWQKQEKTPPVAEPVISPPVKCRAATARHIAINQGRTDHDHPYATAGFEARQKNETAWLNRKAELAAAEQEYREQMLAGDDRIPGRMQTLRDIIDVKKWEINQAAGRYICSHEAVQRISTRNRLNDFMQAHGAELAATLAPELMRIKMQPAKIKNHTLDRSAHCLREALSVWLSAGEEIHYAAEDSDILTAIGFRPDAASRGR